MQRQLPEFLFIEPQGPLKGAGFILCTSPPFYIGKVWKLKDPSEPLAASFKAWQVPGYSIFITPVTSLSDEYNKQRHPVTERMAAYYLTEKIKPNEPAFRKYKI